MGKNAAGTQAPAKVPGAQFSRRSQNSQLHVKGLNIANQLQRLSCYFHF